MIAPEHIAELAKEFGGGFAAYWLHHAYHRVWHRMRLPRHRPRA
jgi:hypothetical protein